MAETKGKARPSSAFAFALAIGLVALHSGCMTDEADTPPPHTVSRGRPIVGGSPDTSQAHMAVVALTQGPGTGYFCTGTLIASSVVLTAAHCLDGVPATAVHIYFGNDVYSGGDYRQCTEKSVHPGYTQGDVVDDIGLLRMSSNAPAGITPIPRLPSSLALTSADVGSPVDFSGFGVTEFNSDGEKLHVSVNLGLVCPGPSSCTFMNGFVVPRAIAYPQSPGGPCSGDSGGPAFMFRSAQEYVVGVTSYGDPGCSEYGVSTKVDASQTWIDGFIGVIPEDCNNNVDDDTDGQTDCDDSECTNHPDCQGQPESCTNNIDDDLDGQTDCDDSDCFTHSNCQTQQENCTNGIDDDDDGRTDCQDGECASHPACTGGDGGLQLDGGGQGGDGGFGFTHMKGGCGCRSVGSGRAPAEPALPLVLFILAGAGFAVRTRRSRRRREWRR
jgi:hypothetical protein